MRHYNPLQVDIRKSVAFFSVLFLALLCTPSFAKDFQNDLKKLKVGTYVEGSYYVGAQKKRFGGYINRTQGYAVTIVTNQLPCRRRITYESIHSVRVLNTRKVTLKYNPEARRFLTRSGVSVGSRAVIGLPDDLDKQFSGTIASVNDSIIVFATKYKSDENERFTASAIAELSVKLDRISYTKRGFKAGVVAGFCIGVIFSSSGADTATESGWATLANILASPKTVIFTLAGATTGSIIGRVSSYDTWSSIPLDRLKFAPSPFTRTPLPFSLTYKF